MAEDAKIVNTTIKPWVTQKHPNFLMQLEAGDVIENLHVGAVTESDAPKIDEVVIVTVWGDVEKTTFVLQMAGRHSNRIRVWDAFILARETTPLSDIRPTKEDSHAHQNHIR